MFISLKIDNAETLSNGGPLSYVSHGRSFEIGRENRDWTLPDPDKFISGRHCEVRFENGAFWLHDVSRNGTFVNGANQRITGPHRLDHGDRLRIGRYIVLVSLENSGHEQASPAGNAGAGRPSPSRPEFASGAPRSSGSADFFAGGPEQQGMTSGQGRNERAAPRGDAPFSFDADPFLAPGAPQKAAQRREQGPSLRLQATPSPPTAPRPAEAGNILRAIAAGAGVSPDVFSQRDPNDVAADIGAVLRIVVDELALLLKARAAAKVLAKSSHRTMISAADNNPLKFVPGAEEILEIMFARRRTGYLDARHSVEDAFHDLKTHEFATYAAMQTALSRLLDDLSPDSIEKRLPASSFASKKSRAWDAFVAIWDAREQAHENGMLDVFLTYFSEAYAKASKPK